MPLVYYMESRLVYYRNNSQYVQANLSDPNIISIIFNEIKLWITEYNADLPDYFKPIEE